MLPATPHRNTRAVFQACIGGSPNSCWRGRRGAQPSVVRGGSCRGPGCAGVPRRTFVGTQDSAVLEGDWQPLTPGWDRDVPRQVRRRPGRVEAWGHLRNEPLHALARKSPGQASWSLFERLAAATKAPHSAYIQAGDHRVLCASPERFLEKRGQTFAANPSKAPCDAEHP